MPNAWSKKRERQYEHIEESLQKRGTPKKRAKEIAARYKTHAATLGTQVVFLDVGTPKRIEPLPASITGGPASSPATEALEETTDDTSTDIVDEEAEAEAALEQVRSFGVHRDLYAELKRLLIGHGLKPAPLGP